MASEHPEANIVETANLRSLEERIDELPQLTELLDQDIIGDPISQFILVYDLEGRQVMKYRWSSRIGGIFMFLTAIGMAFGFISIPEVYSVMNSIAELNFTTEEARWIFIVGLFVGSPLTYGFIKNTSSYGISERDVQNHHIRKCLTLYREGEYEEMLDELDSANPIGSNDKFYHPQQEEELTSLIESLKEADGNGRLEQVSEEIIVPFFTTFCFEELLIMNKSEEFDRMALIEAQETEESSELGGVVVEVLGDVFSPLTPERVRDGIVVLTVGLVSLIVGVAFGGQWAAVPTGVFALYLMYGD